jgi:DNA-binding FadR family transcriptional regulator
MDMERLAALEAHYAAMAATFATKADVESLRADMHKMSADTHKWMVASLIGLFIGFGGLGVTMSQILRQPPVQNTAAAAPAAPSQPVQPIVIYLSPPPQK